MKTIRQKVTAVGLFVAAAVAASAALHADEIAAGRTVVPFDAGWEFKWGGKKDDGGAWQKVDLPHDAQFAQPWTQSGGGARGFKPLGDMWYRKTFDFKELGLDIAGRRAFIAFGGLLCVGDVYVNGTKVASTDYGYLPVWGEMTDALHAGANTIEVWCSTGRREGSRWYTGAGLFRDAKIVVLPQISIARNGVYVKPTVDCAARRATVDVTVELDGFTGKGRNLKLDVEVSLKDASGNEVAAKSVRAPWSKNAHQEVALEGLSIADAQLWDVDAPNLYTADVRLVLDGREIDRETVRFGLRTIEIGPTFGLKLNGRKLFLKSMSNHHDMGCVGAAAYRRAIARQFKLMKAFGYNAVRCSHNPYSEDFYDLADEMGLLVVDELIDKWSDKSCWFGRRPFTTIWPQLVTAWMKRDRNHPSIFAWSFGNELQMRDDLCGFADVNDWGVTMYRVLKAFSQRWDATRPTTVAMFPSRAGALSRKDKGFWDDPQPPELACVTDFASFNYQWQAYPNYLKHAPGLTVFQSEAAVRELQSAYLGMDHARMIGCSYWGAIEYWGESDGWPKKGWNYAFFSHTLEPYPAAFLIKSVMTDEPVVQIAVESGKGSGRMWNDVDVGRIDEVAAWEGTAGETKKVRVYTNAKTVELFLNGRSLGAKANDAEALEARNIVTWEVPFEPGELKAVADGHASMVRTAGAVARIAVEVEDAGTHRADGHDLIYVTCRAVDAEGVPVRAWNGRVAFACAGAAEFLCCDNGDHSTDELFTRDVTAKNAKDGFILAVFRTGRTGGEAKITVSPEGLEPVTKTVTVQ